MGLVLARPVDTSSYFARQRITINTLNLQVLGDPHLRGWTGAARVATVKQGCGRDSLASSQRPESALECVLAVDLSYICSSTELARAVTAEFWLVDCQTQRSRTDERALCASRRPKCD